MARKKGKSQPTIRSEFGKTLREFRLRSRDPDDNGRLTQERLSDLLGEIAALPYYSHVDISRWERGGNHGRVIDHEDRGVLVGLIQVLHYCGGIASIEDANTLLQAGDYGPLKEGEIAQVALKWPRLTQKAGDTDSTGHQIRIHGRRRSFVQIPAILLPRQVRQGNLAAPFMVPALPPQGIFGRDDLLTRLLDMLQLEGEEMSNVPPLALRGMGGVGKTTLTLALGRLEGMQNRFPDGILWVALGPNPTIRFLQEDWGRSLGIDLLPERDEMHCRHRLQEALYHRKALLIVDDVWEIQHGKQFEVAGPRCRTLFTTRELDIAHHLATKDRTVKVDILNPEASLQLLHRLVPEAVAGNKKDAQKLCERLEYLPLAITLAGRMLANETDMPSRMQRLIVELLERRDARLHLLQMEGRLGLDEENPVSLYAILGLSVDRLSQVDKERFAMAAVFGGEPLTWDLKMAAHVWDCPVSAAEDTVARFLRRGLVEAHQDGRYWMHALLADYAQLLMDEMGL
ncbi:MAG: hypothetical protein KF770_05210 [Anaerolineae bacterium]|nr:hypothetical protein [Anaerolineae bacterium]